MALSREDYYCSQFQPNTFDPSRCCSCLRPDHMHLGVTPVTAQQVVLPGWDADDNEALSEGTSVSSDDVRGAWTYEWSLVHSLSPDWELNICDTDTQSSSPSPIWDCSERSRSPSRSRSSEALRDMTRFDPSPNRASRNPPMDGRRSRDMSRRTSVSRGEREPESGYFSPDRKGTSERPAEDGNKASFRYYERGHALPSNYVLEPKACVPFRNVCLGLPSQRRTPETYLQDMWRSESPQRYTSHSNFRRGTESVRNSPTRHSSVSPDRCKSSRSAMESQRGTSLPRSHTRAHTSSHGSSQVPSHVPSRQTSGRSSPSRRRGSIVSRPPSPSHKRRDSVALQNGERASRRSSRDMLGSRPPSHASNRHSLDSEQLYRNLDSISRRGSTAYDGSQTSPRIRTAVNSSNNTRTRSSCEVSPSRNGYGSHSQTPRREQKLRDSRDDATRSFSKTHDDAREKPPSSPRQDSWRGSSHSLLSFEASRGSSPSRRGVDSQVLAQTLTHVAATGTDLANGGHHHTHGDRSKSSGRGGMDSLLLTPPKKSQAEIEEASMTIDDYLVLAHIPTIHLESEEEHLGLRRRNQSPSPRRDQRYRTPRGQDEIDVHSSRVESDERGRVRERGRDRREKCRDLENGRSSRRQSTTSVHTQGSDTPSGKRRLSKTSARELAQTEWQKHWFVLSNTKLRYYRDSEAEESDDMDGEIDLTTCVSVYDCDLEKNFGFEIQTKRAVFTLSATTSRIRRNWVKLVKQAIQSNMHQSDTGSEKANPLSRRPSSCQPSARLTRGDSGYEATADPARSTKSADHGRHRSTDGDFTARPSDLAPASQREAGEGWDREQARRLEERNRWFEEGIPFSEMGSRWDSMELKKGSVPIPVIDTLDAEVSLKWAEFERLSFTEMSAQSLIGAQALHASTQQASQPLQSPPNHLSIPEAADRSVTDSHSDTSSSYVPLPSVNSAQNSQLKTAATLQEEALSLREEVETIKKERVAMGMEGDSPCGPQAPCRARLEAMEAAHRRALQDLREQHARELRGLERERDRALQEEREAASKALEAVKAAHREELERARGSAGGAGDAPSTGHMPRAEALHSELDSLSQRYSEKCLELSRTEQGGKSRETELCRKEREIEQLRRENQELKAKLAEEVSRMRHFITGQRSEMTSPSDAQRPASDVETRLRAKENEVEYLKKEISCLQSEVQALTKDKEAAYERYKEAYVQLSDTKNLSQLEVNSLNEHLRLANAAVQEGARRT